MKKNIVTYTSVYILLVALFALASCTGNKKEETKRETILSAINKRKSVRNFIKERPVGKEDVDALIKAGMAAPSGKDIRPWELLIVDDRHLLDKMAEELPTAKMLADSPMAIIVCGDTTKSFYWYLDCAAVTQNILIAAEAMNLGAVWTAAYPYRDRMSIVINNIGIPSHILPLAVIPVGYPEGPQNAKNKYNKTKIHTNKW